MSNVTSTSRVRSYWNLLALMISRGPRGETDDFSPCWDLSSAEQAWGHGVARRELKNQMLATLCCNGEETTGGVDGLRVRSDLLGHLIDGAPLHHEQSLRALLVCASSFESHARELCAEVRRIVLQQILVAGDGG